jgi:hypothetical protein
VDAYFQRAIRKLERKGDQALLLIKNQCASATADDTHHFHHLFTSIRIKENESATNFFKRFTFARTEAEGVGNVYLYSEQSLVNFALAGLSTSKYPKYDTAVQLYNLERDSGKSYSLEDIEKKIFAIDKKTSREAAKTRLAQGNVAMGQRGERSTYHSQNSRHPRCNGHRKTADANAVLDSNSSNRYANTTCYYCGKKGHIVPNCPDKKKGKEIKGTHQKNAQGHVARSTEDAPSPTELVCLARHIPLPEIRPPRSGPAPAITVDPHARESVNTRIFVSLAIRVDESVLSWEQERAYERYHLPETFEGDLEP